MSKESAQNGVIDKASKRSRRQLLTGAVGAIGAVAAGAIVNPTTARAGTDGDVVLGAYNDAGSGTTLIFTNGGGDGLGARAFGNGRGVIGTSANWAGLYGDSQSGEGLFASSGGGSGTNPGHTRTGVHGVTDSSADAAVWGENVATGGKGGNGVYGGTKSTFASGVYGQNDDVGYGVAGRAAIGTGTLGDSANGTGVAATSANGTALSVSGPAKFDRSGRVSIAYPAKSATVAVPYALSTAALVFALMQNAVSGIYVTSAVPNTSSGKVTINLNKAPGSASSPKMAKIAWFVVN